MESEHSRMEQGLKSMFEKWIQFYDVLYTCMQKHELQKVDNYDHCKSDLENVSKENAKNKELKHVIVI